MAICLSFGWVGSASGQCYTVVGNSLSSCYDLLEEYAENEMNCSGCNGMSYPLTCANTTFRDDLDDLGDPEMNSFQCTAVSFNEDVGYNVAEAVTTECGEAGECAEHCIQEQQNGATYNTCSLVSSGPVVLGWWKLSDRTCDIEVEDNGQ